MAETTASQNADTAPTSQQSAEAFSKNLTFRFKDLPPEVRDLIWEATLPPGRVFHVTSTCTGSDDILETQPSAPSPQGFKFYIHHAPPGAIGICRESRAVALRKGIWLSPQKPSPGVWFSPERDILYFDRNMRYLFKTRKGRPLATIEGFDKVLNIGLSWRAWFRDIPRLAPGEDMRTHWRLAIAPLFLYAPHLQTINFVLPKVRSAGGVVFGREAYGAANYPCELVPLPETTKLPWDKVAYPETPGSVPVSTATLVGGRSYLTTWRAIRRQMERSLEVDGGGEVVPVEEDEWAHEMRSRRRHMPQVIGWWLLRPGAPKNYEQQHVRDFIL